MFGLGTWEILIILVAALVFIGPGKLPELARSLGKGMRELKRAVAGFEGEIHRATSIDEPPAPAQPRVAETVEEEPPPPDPDSHEGLYPPDDPRSLIKQAAEVAGMEERVATVRPTRPATPVDQESADSGSTAPDGAETPETNEPDDEVKSA